MSVYLKIHCRNDIETIACCDEDLLNKCFKDGSLRIEITNQFFGGNLVCIEDALDILKNACFFNIVGENIITKAIKHKIVSKEGIRYISGVPMALKMVF